VLSKRTFSFEPVIEILTVPASPVEVSLVGPTRDFIVARHAPGSAVAAAGAHIGGHINGLGRGSDAWFLRCAIRLGTPAAG
jgi:hypothetical protein